MLAMGTAQAHTVETVIHTFGNFPKGVAPYGTLVRDTSGNLYGTSLEGGAANLGVVFRLNESGYQVLYSFRGGADGANPNAGVTLDPAGNLYGTTYLGGAANAGVVYKKDPSGQETVLYTFTGGADGANPYAGLMADSAGNLYGTTVYGGSAKAGVVYKLDPSGQETVLYSFKGGTDGANPYGGVIADPSGNLYGTTYLGGKNLAGALYKLDTSGHQTVLHDFSGGAGVGPRAAVVRDPAGNLYGTATNVVYKLSASGQYRVLTDLPQTTGATSSGVARDAAGNLYGATDASQPRPFGEVYKVDTAGKLTVLYKFPGPGHAAGILPYDNPGVVLDSAGNIYGASAWGGLGGMLYKLNASGQATTLYKFSPAPGGTLPRSGLIRDAAGNLYGTTANGGPANWGAVYRVDGAGHYAVLYTFTGGADGADPGAGVVRDSAGNLYGTTYFGGGANRGVVYRVDPSGHETVLHSFTGGADGGTPNGVVLDSAGNLYGTTFAGGTSSQTGAQEGVVFKLDPAGHETVLHSFTGLSDGGGPTASVTLDSAGNLYGTTWSGGLGVGVVFKFDKVGRYLVLYSFTGGADGGNPNGGVIADPAGNLYGTNLNYGQGGGGVLFKLDAVGNCTVPYSFAAGAGGNGAYGSLVRDAAGALFGTTSAGGSAGCGYGCGVVFELDADGTYLVLHSFTGGVDGSQTESGVTFGSAGTLYGTTPYGGATGGGVLYELTLR